MENHTAKHFVLQLGSLASLYLSLSFLLVLLFSLINLLFPDVADSVYEVEGASSSVRLGIAMTIVFFPTYLLLTRLVNQTRRKEPNGSYLGLTKWLIYLSLLIGGAALLIDLVVVIMTFLEGDITLRFVMKVIAVLIVVGAAFTYYLLDARGYWLKNEHKSIVFAIGAAIVVFVTLAFGFAYIEAPAEVREQKIDDTQVLDLQEIQWRIQDYLVLNGALPESLEVLSEATKMETPTAPEGRTNYRYEITEKGFQLCATFATASQKNEYLYARPVLDSTSEKPTIINPNNWEHGEGEICFERVVNLEE